MSSDAPEVIDLTIPEVIVLDSDSDSDYVELRPSTRKRSLRDEDEYTPPGAGPSVKPLTLRTSQRSRTKSSGSATPTESAGSNGLNGEGKGKKKRKKKRKTPVVAAGLEDGEVSEAEGDAVAMISSSEKKNGQGSRGNGEGADAGRSAEPMRNGQSLLNRIGGFEHQEVRRSGKERDSRKQIDQKEDSKELEDRSKKRKRTRDRDKNRTRDRSPPPSRPRSHSPERRRSERSDHQSSSNPRAADPLFFVDLKPADIPGISKPTATAVIAISDATSSATNGQPIKEQEQDVLLLPAHVSVIGDNGVDPVEILPDLPADSDDEDYIEYLEYDDDRRAPGVVRYFDDLTKIAEEGAKPRRVVCKNCGAEGEHSTRECRVMICLTCGARDEHSTRSCPISKTCFQCGMKGHTRAMCPNRYSRGGASNYEDCDRCGSTLHNINECPTHWRLYEYVDDAQQNEILRSRDEKSNLGIGQGGEGYIASDEWCYNCGGVGHLGDDCRDAPHVPDFPREPSAFSAYNTRSGPFFDPSKEKPTSSRKSRKPPPSSRDGEMWADGYGFVLPMDVGKQGKKKERARMEQRAREVQRDDDDDANDWFGRRGPSGNGRNGRRSSGGSKGPSDAGKKFTFGNIGREDEDRFSGGYRARDGYRDRDRDRRSGGGRSQLQYDDPPGPARETDSIQIRGAARRSNYRSDGGRDGGRYDRDSRNDWESSERRYDKDRGPRYRGGYA